MNAIPPRISTAAEILTRIAWDDTDHLSDLVPYSLYYRAHIASSIDQAADIYTDRFGIAPNDIEMKKARLLLELETDAYIVRCEEEREAEIADAMDAGDVDARGEVVPYERYP